jgi:ribosomal-protein-alanine N-acetyltransferase
MADDPVLECERLVLRLGRRRDAEAVARFHRENDEHLSRFESPKPRAWHSESFWRGELERRREDWGAGASCRLLLFPRGTALDLSAGTVCGSVGLTAIVRGVLHAGWVGYALDERLQGRGLMHEALGRLVAFAFGDLNLHRLFANHSPRNAPSARVLERLGFRQEGFVPAYLFVNGRWEDHVLTGRVNPAWRVPPGLLRRDEAGRVVEVPSGPTA